MRIKRLNEDNNTLEIKHSTNEEIAAAQVECEKAIDEWAHKLKYLATDYSNHVWDNHQQQYQALEILNKAQTSMETNVVSLIHELGKYIW